ncbi:hypothetical protein MUK70_04010 [Dyadobacter chenwenxiniae]|uniref:Uncharacterized protein n=1 Tax=Dyadobacter chenwenxiniae TaxID=2906456 RepID=A0A9X1PSC9_9BACT|nr:hypothetical protein [Dyadobacter chenwenxiniae]MCF0064788.1 hypothetical protein [Dyadobacter chenwenxiniae]UON84156.1 hypothetical protein MUK70_04010 [Dyadobacter chenwenxiniae]
MSYLLFRETNFRSARLALVADVEIVVAKMVRYPLLLAGQCQLFLRILTQCRPERRGLKSTLSRMAWYATARRREKKCFQQDLVLGEVRRIRRQVPGIGTAKLHELMKDFVRGYQIKLGRDKLWHSYLEQTPRDH